MTKEMFIAFRMDDITPGMDWDRFNKARNIFEKYNVKPLLGVVPDNQDEKLEICTANQSFWDILQELEKDGWVMSQHGFVHVYDSADGGLLKLRPKSEFAGLPFDIQKAKLEKGFEILKTKGVTCKVFMAPGHTFDRNTLKALKELGFEFVTDGLSDEAYRYDDMIFIPSKNSRPKCRRGIDTVCLHVNEMEDEDFEELDQFIKNHRDVVVDFSQLMKKEGVVNYGVGIRLQVVKNRLLSKLRRFIAGNKIIHGILARRNR